VLGMSRSQLRKLSLLLWVFLVVVYLFAKINFFTTYFHSDTANYIRQHGKYWIAMAGVAAAIWIVERRSER
jgi:hypothetical protein